MAKAYPPDEYAWRVFRVSILGVLAWIVVAFGFVILRNP